MVAVGTVFCVLTHFVLADVNRDLAESEGPAHFVLLPQTAIWWVFPFFGAIVLSYELTLALWSAFGDRREVILYDAWQAVKAGFDSRRTLRIMGLFLVFPVAVCTFLV